MSLKKYFRHNVYKWHRITSLSVAIPVLMWTISGFLHPVMGTFKPAVKNTHLSPSAIDSLYITVPLQVALSQNNIDSLQNFRIVKLYRGYYYQLCQRGVDSLTYLNCESGNLLLNGDKHYANYLAQRFLGEENKSPNSDEHVHEKVTASITGGTNVQAPTNQRKKQKTRISSTTLLTSFSKDYKASNKILPVYEVAFDREDGIKLYIETNADRLTLASDHKKRWFATFFAFVHSWSFLNGIGKLKPVLLGTFSALCLLSSVFGFAVYNVLNTKKKSTNKSKRWHKILGNIFLLTTLLYSFSGAWHAFAKSPSGANTISFEQTAIARDKLNLDLIKLYPFLSKNERLTNISIVKMNGETYWQVFYKKEKEARKKYINTQTNTVLPEGDAKYSTYLVSQLKGIPQNSVVSTKAITTFNHSYSMMNRRLPVVENKLANGEVIYIETATGDVAAISKPSGNAERFSFSNLHMHHYWEMWLGKEHGKTVKNLILTTTTLGLLLLAMTGMFIYIRKKLA